MEEPIKLISLLQKSFADDKICMYYHGNFDDTFTAKLVSIADYDVGKQAKKRMAFLMTESFQNIIRHGDDQQNDKMANVFGIRGIEPFLHIFSSNLINAQNKPDLEEKLMAINHLDKEQLRAYYLTILEEGDMTEKGGGGLGLIEMAKKSQRPIQAEFKKLANDIFAFNMQIDLIVDEKASQDLLDAPMAIQENLALNDFLIGNDIIFLYKGDFNDDVLTPMLNVLENNTGNRKDTVGYKIYHAAVELMQNVTRHIESKADKKEGIFSLNRTANGYYLCTGNYIADEGGKFKEYVNRLNAMNKVDLDALYRQELKKSIKNEGNNAGVGLIDLRRNLLTPIDIRIKEDKVGNYLVIGIEVPFV